MPTSRRAGITYIGYDLSGATWAARPTGIRTHAMTDENNIGTGNGGNNGITDTNGAGRYLWPALAFFIPFFIHAFAFAAIDVSPFGSRAKSMMVIDNFHQYSPFLVEFRDILRSGGSLLYSWNDGLGSNYWARYGYYLASPLNLLFVFFPARLLPEFIVFLSLTRTGISGLAFFIYAKRKFGAARADGVAFAAMYAISAYTLAYYWNIMWFDCIALLPLIVLGIERLAQKGRGALYCAVLAVAIYSNYYISLIICIFAALYFITYYLAECRRGFINFIKKAAMFAGYSVLSAGLAAVVLLPTWSALAVSQSAGIKFPSRIEFYYNMLEILSGHFFNVDPSVMSGEPNLYCGVAAMILMPLYFINSKIKLREKVAYGALLGFILLSCNINYLNYIWHGLHFPNSLPYRFTFLYILIIAVLGLKTYQNIDGVSRGAVLKVFACGVFYAIVSEAVVPDFIKSEVLYPTLIFLALNAAMIAWAAHSAAAANATAATAAGGAPKSRFYPANAAFSLLLLVTVELAANAALGISSAGVGQRDNYMKNIDPVREAVTRVNKRDPDKFYRVEFLKDTVSNTPSVYGYKGASYFSSTAVLKVTDLMEKLGFRPSSAWYIYKGSTPVINSLLSLRYLLSKEDIYDNPLYPLVDEFNGIRTYENPYCLPLGFFAERDVLSLSIRQPNVFKIQNEFLKRGTGLGSKLGDVLQPVQIEHKESRNAEITSHSGNLYHFRVIDSDEPGFINFTIGDIETYGAGDAIRQRPLYLYVQSRQVDYIWYIKNDKSEGHNIKYYPYIIDMQYFGDIDEIEISIKIEEHMSGDFEMYACSFDEEAFLQAYEILASRPFEIESFSDTKITGTIRTDKPGLLFTTIPYDRGWSVRLNGDMLPREKIESFGEGFIAIEVEHGVSRVEFSFVPENFIAGLSVSAASAFLFAFILLISKRYRAHSLYRK